MPIQTSYITKVRYLVSIIHNSVNNNCAPNFIFHNVV